MTIVTLRPDSTAAAGAFTAVGAASLWEATSDDNDATYAATSTLFDPMLLGFDTYTLQPDERVKFYTVRARGASDAAAQASAQFQVDSGGFQRTVTFDAWNSTSVAARTTGPIAVAQEITQAAISAIELRVQQVFSQSGAGVRIAELYFDLDVRARPVIDSVTATVAVETTLDVQFDYNTSGITEAVRVDVELRDAEGQLVMSVQQVETGANFSNYVASIPLGILPPSPSYSATVTVTDEGWVTGSFASEPFVSVFAVAPTGVNPPVLDCVLDVPNQQVVLTIEQPEGPVSPPVGDCVVVEEFDLGSAGPGAWSDTVTLPAGQQPCHAQLWMDDVLVVPHIEFGNEEVTFDADLPDTVSLRAVIAHCGAAADDATLVSAQITGSGLIEHNLNTTAVIVQAIHSSGWQATIGAEVVSADAVQVTLTPGETVTVVILAKPIASECLVAVQETVPPGGASFVLPFGSSNTIATVLTTTGDLVAWAGIHIQTDLITVENPTGDNLMLEFTGTLVEFDDPDNVRVEVQRDEQRIPLDGHNGDLVPAPGGGPLVVIDRFAPRCAVGPFCDGEPDQHAPTYRARFYGEVEGELRFSQWAICSPGCLPHDGRALLRHPLDGTQDVFTNCVSDEAWDRIRPFVATQATSGGLPYVLSAPWSGRNLGLIIAASTTIETLAIEAILANIYIWYSPTDPYRDGSWQAPQSGTAFVHSHMAGRPHRITQRTVEVEPPPVLLPVLDYPA